MNQVKELAIDVALRQDGSAYITQEFSVVTEEGTEFYLDYYDSGYLTISDFQVSDVNGPYEVLEEGTWDIDASFEAKAGKCGILPIEGGVELCWGITEYGEYQYALEYILHDLVGAYEDADGFNYRFVNEDLSFFPTDAAVTIYNQDGTPLTDEIADIWAFGFDGQIEFKNGTVCAWTQTALEEDADMTIMVRLDKGVLSPERKVTESFEEVKERAFEGSDYVTDEEGGWWIFLALTVFAAAIFVISVIGVAIGSAKRKKKVQNTPYFREEPNHGDLNVSYVLGSRLQFLPKGTLIGARVMRLLSMGSLETVMSALDSTQISLRLVKEPHGGDAYDEAFYTVLQVAAGANGILEARELEQFCMNENNAVSLAKLMDSCEQDAITKLTRAGGLKGTKLEEAKHLTKTGEAQLNEILGLKRYLQEFSLLAERNINEVILWQDYMVYAVLLGIAEQVLKQLKNMYPQQLPQIEQYTRYVSCSMTYQTYLYTAVQEERCRQQTARSLGSGGSASFGGGGGFSGGGSGGTR